MPPNDLSLAGSSRRRACTPPPQLARQDRDVVYSRHRPRRRHRKRTLGRDHPRRICGKSGRQHAARRRGSPHLPPRRRILPARRTHTRHRSGQPARRGAGNIRRHLPHLRLRTHRRHHPESRGSSMSKRPRTLSTTKSTRRTPPHPPILATASKSLCSATTSQSTP